MLLWVQALRRTESAPRKPIAFLLHLLRLPTRSSPALSGCSLPPASTPVLFPPALLSSLPLSRLACLRHPSTLCHLSPAPNCARPSPPAPLAGVEQPLLHRLLERRPWHRGNSQQRREAPSPSAPLYGGFGVLQ